MVSGHHFFLFYFFMALPAQPFLCQLLGGTRPKEMKRREEVRERSMHFLWTSPHNNWSLRSLTGDVHKRKCACALCFSFFFFFFVFTVQFLLFVCVGPWIEKKIKRKRNTSCARSPMLARTISSSVLLPFCVFGPNIGRASTKLHFSFYIFY